jgi:enoyl-CoA hydratase/carnithine racemase
MGVLSVEEPGDGVVLVRWDDGENRFNLTSLREWHSLLDDLERRDGPLALVVTGAGRFFSNGLDLDRFEAAPEEAGPIVDGTHRLFARMLLFPAWTVGALNGHTFAAGAMLASTFDHRLMRADRGYWCLPEVDLGLPLTEQMFAAVTARLRPEGVAEAMLTAQRYGGTDAVHKGLVDRAVAEPVLVEQALMGAAEMADKDRRVIARHKEMLFGAAAAACRQFD